MEPEDVGGAEADRALAELRETLADLQEALELGDGYGRGYFREDGSWPYDVTAYNTLLRYHTKRFLRSRSRDVRDDDDYEVQDVANLGIHVHHGRYRIRVRKSADLRVPVPGDSESAQKFYRQEVLVPDVRDFMNVLVVWRVGAAGVELRLAKPKGGDLTRESVDVEWEVSVPGFAVERAAQGAPDGGTPGTVADDIETIRAADEPDGRTRKDEAGP
jgi:hypothetical protein